MKRSPKFTARQLQALKLWTNGLSLKEVANEMKTDHSTAEFHIANCKRKLGFTDKALVTKWALKHGLTHLTGI